MKNIAQSKINILYGVKSHLIREKLNEYFSSELQKYILILDLKHIWQPLSNHKKIRYIRPINKSEIFNLITHLDEFITPRIEIIVIDSLFDTLRDYKGSSAKEFTQNKKLYAFYLNKLNSLKEKNITIIINSIEDTINLGLPLMNDVNLYYKVNLIYL